MNRIYLIRHGEKEIFPGDPPLTEKGIEQAKKTANYLKDQKVVGIWSSPSLRTRQTAEYIATEINVPIQIDTALRERMNWDANHFASFEEFLKLWDKATEDRYFTPPVGDSSVAAGNRLGAFLSESQNDGNMVYVTHGGVISDFLLNIFSHQEIEKAIESQTSNNRRIAECSVTILESKKGKYQIVKLASTEHLL